MRNFREKKIHSLLFAKDYSHESLRIDFFLLLRSNNLKTLKQHDILFNLREFIPPKNLSMGHSRKFILLTLFVLGHASTFRVAKC